MRICTPQTFLYGFVGFLQVFLSYVLCENSHSLGYSYDVAKYTLLSEHPLLSAKYKPKVFSTFLSKKKYPLLVLTQRTKPDVWTITYTVKHHINKQIKFFLNA